MTCLSKNISLEIMKFFLSTSVPKILSERKDIASNQEGVILTYADSNLLQGIY